MRMPRSTLLSLPLLLPIACGGDDEAGSGDEIGATDTSGSTSDSSESGSESSSTAGDSSDSSSDTATTGDSSSDDATTSTDSSESTDTGPSGCQGDPMACEPGTVCDVISGDCVPPETACTLAGPSVECGDVQCGPGSVCDDQGACIPIAPCGQVACEGAQCWGDACVCDRQISCNTATAELLNGSFATDIFGLDFADDCNAWMVTLRSGTDYLRRMTPAGDLTEWPGIANLNMGEVKVLKAINPQFPAPGIDDVQSPFGPDQPHTVGGDDLGEVAITYTCCPSCGCQANPPQGVARLIEGDPQPLPIVLPGIPTQGNAGPFANTAADAGPMGLTWGDDLQLYVGNSMANGNFDTADLAMGTQDMLAQFDSRVTAAAPISAVHLLVALDTGELLRFNTAINSITFVVDLEVGVTSLSHDSFTGKVYAGLSDLGVVEVDPFTGEFTDFQTMPGKGRVAVSPDGKLWYVPAKYAGGNLPLSNWDLPSSF
ncbi:hypothetical protein ACNOYE_02255 [Nannocystaceae bacterium ST9]